MLLPFQQLRHARPRQNLRRAAIIACGLALAAGCSTPPVRPATQPTPVVKPTAPIVSPGIGPSSPPTVALRSLPGWQADTLDGLAAAIRRQCALRNPPAPWPGLCSEFGTLAASGNEGLRAWLEQRFVARALIDAKGADTGLMTGYYEPLLNGSRRRESAAQVPLYARPADLLTIDLVEVEPRLAGMRLRGRVQGNRVVPYHSRADIDTRNALAGHELLWVDDPVDAFFLEIQGSGRVQLRDGSVARVGYADQNGHPYRAIGRTLIDQGALPAEAVTAPSIRDWLRANPAQARTVMHSNPSVVFFRELPANTADPTAGPPGAMGVPLTTERSLAIDRSVVPLGSLLWLDTVHPVSGQAWQRAMVGQDTGGAIVGRIRADVFWGFGAEAARAAGTMKTPGRMWVMEPR